MKILILGAGGLGCFFGGHLQKVSCDITFLVKEKNKKILNQNGIEILSEYGNFKIKPVLISKNQLEPIFDIIILSCKSYSLDDAINDLKPLYNRAVIIPLLNGLTHLKKLEKKFGKKNVFGGVAHVSSNILTPGRVQHVGQINRLSFGVRHNSNEKVAKNFYKICKKANFDTILSENIEQDIWEKWIFLATIAGATTLFRTSINKISEKNDGLKFVKGLWHECINLSKENGIFLRSEAKKLHYELLFNSKADFKASMLIDMEKKLQTEYKHIFYEFIKLGNKIKFEMPYLKLVYLNMKIYEEELKKN